MADRLTSNADDDNEPTVILDNVLSFFLFFLSVFLFFSSWSTLIFFSTILKFDFNPKLCFTFLVDMHKMKPQNVLGVSKTTKLNYDLMESCKIKRRNLLNTIQMFFCSKIRQQSTILFFIIFELE